MGFLLLLLIGMTLSLDAFQPHLSPQFKAQLQALQKVSAQDLSNFMRQIKELAQQLQATPKEQRITKLIALQPVQDANNMGIDKLNRQIGAIANMSAVQLQPILPKKELVDGFMDIITNINSALSTLSLTPDAINELKKLTPQSPIIKKMQDNIDAFIKFAPTAEQLEKGLDNIANIGAKRNAADCITLLEQMESQP